MQVQFQVDNFQGVYSHCIVDSDHEHGQIKSHLHILRKVGQSRLASSPSNFTLGKFIQNKWKCDLFRLSRLKMATPHPLNY